MAELPAMKVGFGLGSNLGDRRSHLQNAKSYLSTLSKDFYLVFSSLYETLPINCPPASPAFLNAVIEVEYEGDPQSLLAQIKLFENDHGRDRNLPPNSPRAIDVDILYFGDDEICEPDLLIPHPRLSARRFVLKPLCEICADRRIVSLGKTVRQLLDELPVHEGEVKVMNYDW